MSHAIFVALWFQEQRFIMREFSGSNTNAYTNIDISNPHFSPGFIEKCQNKGDITASE